jgi:hypothetical protein
MEAPSSQSVVARHHDDSSKSAKEFFTRSLLRFASSGICS